MDEPTQDQSAASVQMPDTLHIDLSHANPEDICFTLYKSFILLTKQDWELISCGFVTCDVMTTLTFTCMDLIQTFSEAIVDVLIPQVYRYTRTYGTFSPTILGLNEDCIHTYLGDSVGQALTNILKTSVQNFVSTKKLLKLLVGHISKAVNSILTLTTKASIWESRLPVVFVSGCCVTSTGEMKDMAYQLALVLIEAMNPPMKPSQVTEVDLSPTASYELIEEVESALFFGDTTHFLKDTLKKYISHMVDVLKRRLQRPCCEMNSSNHEEICIRVGTNVRVFIVEDSESHGLGSCSGLDVVPGVVPDTDTTESPSECFSSVTVTNASQQIDPRMEREIIKDVADEMVQEFFKDKQEAEQRSQGSSLGWLEDVFDIVKLSEFTNRIFNVAMSGQYYQIPFVPAGIRMCDTVTYRKGKKEDGIIAHAIYLWTEEVATRCALQVLLWSARNLKGSDSLSPNQQLFSPDPDFDVPRNGAGHLINPAFRGSPPPPRPPPCPHPQRHSVFSQGSNATYDVISKLLEPTPSELLESIVITSLYTVLAAEILTAIGVRNNSAIFDVVQTVIEQLQDLDPMLDHNFHVSLMGQSHKDISQSVIADLLVEFGSVEVMHEAVRSGDHSFEEALLGALRKQLTVHTSQENAAKKTTCDVFKKFNRLCCKKTSKKPMKTTHVSPLTTDQEQLGRRELLNEQTEQCWCCRAASSFRNMISSVARTISKPFITCFGPLSERKGRQVKI